MVKATKDSSREKLCGVCGCMWREKANGQKNVIYESPSKDRCVRWITGKNKVVIACSPHLSRGLWRFPDSPHITSRRLNSTNTHARQSDPCRPLGEREDGGGGASGIDHYIILNIHQLFHSHPSAHSGDERCSIEIFLFENSSPETSQYAPLQTALMVWCSEGPLERCVRACGSVC